MFLQVLLGSSVFCSFCAASFNPIFLQQMFYQSTSIVPSAAEATLNFSSEIVGFWGMGTVTGTSQVPMVPMDANGCQCPIDPIDPIDILKHVIYMVWGQNSAVFKHMEF